MQDQLWHLSIAALAIPAAVGLLSSLRPYRRKRAITFARCLTAGLFLSGFAMFFALYYCDSTDGSAFAGNLVGSLFISLKSALGLFVFNGNYANLMAQTAGWSATTVERYEILAAALLALAPLTACGFVLTFIKNLCSHLRYWISRLTFWRTVHVFSEVNERSLSLAHSIVENRRIRLKRPICRLLFGWIFFLFDFLRRPVLVFTGVTDDREKRASALIEEAKELNAILFRKDLASVAHGRLPIRRISFYLISENEDAKLTHTAALLKRNYRRARLYLFSDSQASRAFLCSYTKEEKNAIRTEVIRVDDIRALVYHTLDENGHLLFKRACEKNGEKVISAAIIGLGRYGMEMLKGLLWYCQLPRYTVHLTVIDASPDAAERIEAACPELVIGPHRDVPGDMRYRIEVLQRTTGTLSFETDVRHLENPTYVFVSLGDDESNVSTALEVRRVLALEGKHPRVETVVYSASLRSRIDADVASSTEMAEFDIYTIGNLSSFYTEGTVIASDLVSEGFGVHRRYGECVGVSGKNGFYMNDYNFYSSLTKALHERLRIKLELDIPGVDKPWDQRTEEEKLAIGLVEHVRWNAYLRTEGYQYSGSPDKNSRSTVARLHNNLVPVTQLTDEDLRKDA